MSKLLVWLIFRALCGPAVLPGGRTLRNGRGMLVLGIMAVCAAAAIALAAGLQEHPLRSDEVFVVRTMVAAFCVLGLAIVCEATGINHSYDDAGLSYRSIWSRNRRVAWAQLASIQWRPVAKQLRLVPLGGGRPFNISPMLGGLAPFAELALRQVPSFVVAADPEAKAALQLMAAGRHTDLVATGEAPTALMQAAQT